MLVLARKVDERVVVGEGDTKCTIVVVEIRGDKVRLGFVARADVIVDRLEVYDAKARAKKESLCPKQPESDKVTDRC